MQRFFTVYKTTNLLNDRFYIGVHITDDPQDDYLGSGKRLKYEVAKYGPESFKKEILAVYDNVDEMFELERQLVTEALLNDQNCLNLNLGGCGGYGAASKQTRKKIYSSENQKKRSPFCDENWLSEHGEKLDLSRKKAWKMLQDKAQEMREQGWKSSGFSGKSHTEEHRQHMHTVMKQKQSGEKNSQFGTCWIYSDTEKKNKKIRIDELQSWIDYGWTKGRKKFP